MMDCTVIGPTRKKLTVVIFTLMIILWFLFNLSESLIVASYVFFCFSNPKKYGRSFFCKDAFKDYLVPNLQMIDCFRFIAQLTFFFLFTANLAEV